MAVPFMGPGGIPYIMVGNTAVPAPEGMDLGLQPPPADLAPYAGPQVGMSGPTPPMPAPQEPVVELGQPTIDFKTPDGGFDFAGMERTAPEQIPALSVDPVAEIARAEGREPTREDYIQQGITDVATLGDMQMREDLEMRRDFEEEEARRQAELQEQSQKYNEAVEKVKNFEYDKDMWWMTEGDRERGEVGAGSVAKGLGLAIAAALQSMGSALTGGPADAGMRTINGAINRSMQLQRAQLEKAKTVAGAERFALGDMRNIFRDERAAEFATRNMMIEGFQSRLQQMQQGITNEVTLNNMDRLNKQLEEQKRVNTANIQQQLRSNQIARYNAKTQRMGVLASMFGKNGKAGEEGGENLREKEVNDITQEISALDSAMRLIKRHGQISDLPGFLGSISGGVGANVPFVETDAKTFNAQRNDTVARIVKSRFGGQASENDRRMIEKMVPSVTDTKAQAAAKMKAIWAEMTGSLRNKLKAYSDLGYNRNQLEKLSEQYNSRLGAWEAVMGAK